MTAFTSAEFGTRSCIVAQRQSDQQLTAMRGGLTAEKLEDDPKVAEVALSSKSHGLQRAAPQFLKLRDAVGSQCHKSATERDF